MAPGRAGASEAGRENLLPASLPALGACWLSLAVLGFWALSGSLCVHLRVVLPSHTSLYPHFPVLQGHQLH